MALIDGSYLARRKLNRLDQPYLPGDIVPGSAFADEAQIVEYLQRGRVDSMGLGDSTAVGSVGYVYTGTVNFGVAGPIDGNVEWIPWNGIYTASEDSVFEWDASFPHRLVFNRPGVIAFTGVLKSLSEGWPESTSAHFSFASDQATWGTAFTAGPITQSSHKIPLAWTWSFPSAGWVGVRFSSMTGPPEVTDADLNIEMEIYAVFLAELP